jgi:hypothetical protein
MITIDFPPAPVDPDRARVVVDHEMKTELRKPFEHDQGVVGEQDVGEIADPIGEGGKNERAVGQTLGPRR